MKESPGFFAARPPAPKIPEALLKLQLSQAIEMEMHVVKDVGRDHANFSPAGAYLFVLLLSSFVSKYSNYKLSFITTHYFGRRKYCTTSPRNTLPGLLTAWGSKWAPT